MHNIARTNYDISIIKISLALNTYRIGFTYLDLST